jgi:hypothetical protein
LPSEKLVPEKPFLFELYRLNVVESEDAYFPFMGKNIRSDSAILSVIERATESRFDQDTESGRYTFRWSLREFHEYLDESDKKVVGVTLGRSILRQSGQTVTDTNFEAALTQMSPPSSETIHLFFYMKRHLVIVEYNSAVLGTQLWRTSLHEILDKAAISLGLLPGIRLEPVPRSEEILKEFRSFQRLTRLRVKLRIPNPELDRRTEQLRREMLAGEIREYTQDMKNPNGLSQSESALPFATAAMAQAGYKDGEVIMSGFRDGRKINVRTGKHAARGRIERLRDFVRGISVTVRTQEAKYAMSRILEEVDRIAELPPPPGEDRATDATSTS